MSVAKPNLSKPSKVTVGKDLGPPARGPDRPIAAEGNRRVAFHMRRIRRHAGISQANVGEAIGVTYQAVQRMEAGEIRISSTFLPALSRLFGVPIDAFFAPVLPGDVDDIAQEDRLEAQLRELMEAFNRITHLDAQRSLSAMARVFAKACTR